LTTKGANLRETSMLVNSSLGRRALHQQAERGI
jgi:hypothetical protein